MIQPRIGLCKAFGPVVVPESSLSRARDGFGRARDSHYLVPLATPQRASPRRSRAASPGLNWGRA
jgi:hypothetical protein